MADVESDSSEEFLNKKAPMNQHVTLTIDELAKVVQLANGHQAPPPTPPSGLGNPGPLGLGAFATTTLLLSIVNADVFITAEAEKVVLPLALAFGGIAQFIAGLYEFKLNNTFGATAFCGYGAFWVSFAFLAQWMVPLISPENVSHAVGLFLLGWTIFTFYLLIASFRVSLVVFIIFVLLFPTFMLLTVGNFTESKGTIAVGGFFGIFCAIAAFYGSAATVINNSWGYPLVPVVVGGIPTLFGVKPPVSK